MNDLTMYRETSLTVPDDDGWNDAAAEASQRILRGTLLKFSDWRWTKGKEAEEVKDGTELIAIATASGRVKWKDGKPVEYRMREPGKGLPDREELGDTNQAEWDAGPDGYPRDPWQNTKFVYLVDEETAEAFTFSTSSWGGRDAVIMLGDQIGRMRLAHPGAVPVVALGSAPMQTRFGRKSKPVFRVVGWRRGDGGTALAPDGAPPKQIEQPSMQQELDDEIPF